MKFGKNNLLRLFEKLSYREQLLSISTFIGIVFYSLFLLVYDPIASEKKLLDLKINVARQTYQQLIKIKAQVMTLRENNLDATGDIDSQSILTVIDVSSKQLEIAQATKKMIPDGVNKITLWVENIAFDKLIQWLAVLKTKHGIEIDQININRDRKISGTVNAKILLQK